jgi:hypothetical protein
VDDRLHAYGLTFGYSRVPHLFIDTKGRFTESYSCGAHARLIHVASSGGRGLDDGGDEMSIRKQAAGLAAVVAVLAALPAAATAASTHGGGVPGKVAYGGETIRAGGVD